MGDGRCRIAVPAVMRQSDGLCAVGSAQRVPAMPAPNWSVTPCPLPELAGETARPGGLQQAARPGDDLTPWRHHAA